MRRIALIALFVLLMASQVGCAHLQTLNVSVTVSPTVNLEPPR